MSRLAPWTTRAEGRAGPAPFQDDDDDLDVSVDEDENADFDLDLQGDEAAGGAAFLDALLGGGEGGAEPLGSDDADGIELSAAQRMAIDLSYAGIDDKSFYEILLLPRNADTKAIKRSYYRLSKEYHPDKFYRKSLGPYKVKLEVLFNKITEAYRILSDEGARSDYDDLVFGKNGRDVATVSEASTTVDFVPDTVRLRQANKEAKESVAARGGRKVTKQKPLFMQNLQRELAERIAKARRHIEAGEAAMERGEFQDAASNFQLAVALDDRNTRAKTLFKRAQSQHRNGRAEELYRQAQESLLAEDTKRAAELLQKAVDCKPTKGKYYHEFGKLVISHTLQQRVGLELLRKAVEMEPRDVNFNTELARAYEELGMPSNAVRAYERVLHLDKRNAEATKALKKLK